MEVMEAVFTQVKGACEKLKEETNAQNEHIRKMLQEMSDRYYLWNVYDQNLSKDYQEVDV